MEDGRGFWTRPLGFWACLLLLLLLTWIVWPVGVLVAVVWIIRAEKRRRGRVADMHRRLDELERGR